MEQQEKDICEAMMRKFPCDLAYIEGFIESQSRERVLKLCEFLECNEKVLAHRILGWKQYKDPMRDSHSCPAKSPVSEM